MNSEASKILAELADVYELSLSIGSSIDIDENCQKFFKSVVSRKSLKFISVWVRKNEEYLLLNSFPKTNRTKEKIKKGSELKKTIDGMVSGSIVSPKAQILIKKDNPPPESSYFYKSDTLLISFAQGENTSKLTARELSQLNTLLAKFIVSVKACLTHKMLVEESKRRQRYQEKLNKRESLFRFGANSLSEGIIVTDLNDCITYVNRAMEDITGYSNSEMLGSVAHELFKPIGISDYINEVIIAKRKNDINEVYEIQQIHKLGYKYWVRITASSFKNQENQIVGTIGTMLNINDQKLIDDKLKLIIDSALDAVITMDQKGRITEWNRNAEKIFGYKYGEVIGKELSKFIIPNQLREAHKKGLKNYFDTGNGPVLNKRIEITAIDKNKREFPIELSVTPIQQNEYTFFSAFVRDISTLKNDQKQKEEMIHKMESLNRELTDFAYIVSHDMKAPLRAVGTLADIFYDDYFNLLDNKGKKLLYLLKGRVSRMHKMIDGILQYSKIGNNAEDYQINNVNDIIHEILDHLDASKKIKVTIQPFMPSILFHKYSLVQIFQNLIGNSYKYMDKEHGHIHINHYDVGDYHTFEIKDNGPGIDKEYHHKIFEIFQSLHPKDTNDSTGIGLSIVRRIIENNGGKITVESTPGEGATFRFTIPKYDGI